jgi:hypothetical protein
MTGAKVKTATIGTTEREKPKQNKKYSLLVMILS